MTRCRWLGRESEMDEPLLIDVSGIESCAVDVSTCQPIPLACIDGNHELFRVTPAGRVERDGVDITDDDAAMAQVLCELMRVAHGVEVKRVG